VRIGRWPRRRMLHVLCIRADLGVAISSRNKTGSAGIEGMSERGADVSVYG